MCDVDWYQLDIVGLSSTHSVDSGTKLLERDWTLSYSGVAHREVSGGCGDTHKPLTEHLRVGVLPGEQEGHFTAAASRRREGCC